MSEHRVLLASSPRWCYLPPAGRAMRALFDDGGYQDAVLVHRDGAGLERAAGRWWQLWGGRTEQVMDAADVAPKGRRRRPGRVEDLVAAVERVDEVWLFIWHLDPAPLEVMVRAQDLGIPGLLRYEGRYPYRPGTPQARGEHPAQVAARARERNADARRRVQESRQARRRVA